MSSPQKENGYTAIANELLEHIYSARLTCLELKTILVILRYTYGFNGRKETELSYSFIAKAIGIQRRNAIRNISSLVAKNMIFITGNRGEHDGNIIRFNKNYDSWILPSVASDTSVVYDTTPSVASDTQQNKNIKQDIKQEYCACAFFESLWNEYPNKKGKARVSKKSMEAMNKIGYEEMHRALERYKADKPDWQQWQNGSTFFNSGYVDYLDATYTATAEVETEEHNGKHNDDLQQWCTDGLI